jgi:biotin carboxyl carrier protein
VTRLLCADGRAVEAAVKATPEQVEVTVDGRAFVLDVARVAPGVFVLRQGDRVRTFHCVRDGEEIHLFWNGATYRLVEEGEARRAAQRQQAGGLEAPMPGKVIKVSVAVGDSVAKGQEILVVEAMKMENAIRAPRPGRVEKIHAKLGDMVTPGVTLVELA